jgi:uncharacterized protein with NRDE domain
MCTLVILRRPDHDWPVIVGANRDEMVDRPWHAPDRHWPDRPEVVAGQDLEAGGTWLGLNDHGVVAGILNRPGALGPAPGKRSRGELVLEALDHADAAAAAAALSHIDGRAYRPFNLVIADNRDAFWLALSQDGGVVDAQPIPDGLSMITANDLNDPETPRIRRFLPNFRDSAPPDPVAGDWQTWQALLGDTSSTPGDGPAGAMTIETEVGFGTVSSSLIALPAVTLPDDHPHWLFADGPPNLTDYAPVAALALQSAAAKDA